MVRGRLIGKSGWVGCYFGTSTGRWREEKLRGDEVAVRVVSAVIGSVMLSMTRRRLLPVLFWCVLSPWLPYRELLELRTGRRVRLGIVLPRPVWWEYVLFEYGGEYGFVTLQST